jgi:hypothetical protein
MAYCIRSQRLRLISPVPGLSAAKSEAARPGFAALQSSHCAGYRRNPSSAPVCSLDCHFSDRCVDSHAGQLCDIGRIPLPFIASTNGLFPL